MRKIGSHDTLSAPAVLVRFTSVGVQSSGLGDLSYDARFMPTAASSAKTLTDVPDKFSIAVYEA